jgi:hypothetical protein
MDEKDIEYLERNWRKVPLAVLAERFSLSHIELTSLLRRKGIATDIQPIELAFIDKNIDRMPASAIQDKLALTTTQFSQIIEMVGKKRRKSLSEMSLSEATAKAKWLIEEKLQFGIDDFLPRRINNKHFSRNDLSDCIRFAETEKKKDSLYRYFPAVAFIVCNAYPHKFRPFQFRHAKDNDYFRGAGGKKNLINAARWVIEKKMGYKPESLPVVCKSKYFLRSKDLQFFGIGYHWFRIYFSSQSEFIAAILNEYKILLGDARGETRQLREILTEAGRPPETCEVPGCYFDDEFGLDIHYTVPVSASNQVSINVNSATNLIALCPNHHRIANRFAWRGLDFKNPEKWTGEILDFVREQEKRSEPEDSSTYQ